MSHPEPLPFTKFDEAKLAFYQKNLGEMTEEEALALAVQADVICGQLPFGDVARGHFVQEARILLEYSVLLEKKRAASPITSSVLQ